MRRSRRWWFWPPLVLIVVLYLLPLAGSTLATNPNEIVRIELAVSVAVWARLDIGAAAEVYGMSEDVAIRAGRVYSDKAPGLSLAAVPMVWVAAPFLVRQTPSDLPSYWSLRHLLTFLLVALPGVGLAFLIAEVAATTEPHQRPAFAIITALATPLWSYSTVFFGHVPAAFLATLAWFLLLGFPGHHSDLNARRAVLGGVAAGFAVATEYPTLLLAVVLFGALLVRRTPRRIVTSAVAGAFAGVLPALLYHQFAFGSPWLTGYGLKALADFQAIHQTGVLGVSLPTVESLWGVLFSAHRGAVFYCPLLALMPLGLRQTIREHGWRDAGPVLCAVVLYVLFAAGFVDWQAGWCAAARHMVPILPLAVAFALLAAARLVTGKRGMLLVAVLVMASGTNSLLTIGLTPFFPPEFSAPLAQLVMPSLIDGDGFHNLLSSCFRVAPIVVVALVGVTALSAMVWAAGHLVVDQKRLSPVISITIVAVILMGYSWWGSERSDETEFMRAQVLRRLGHIAAADRIEAQLGGSSGPADE
jgi:hypothetical protein